MQNQFLGVNILYRYLINHIVRFISLFCLCVEIIKLLVFADEHNNIWHEHVVWLWDTELVCFISTIHTSHQAWCKDSRSILIACLRNKRNASVNLSPSSPSLSVPTLTLPYEFYFIYYVNISLLCKRASLRRNLQKITTRRKTKAILVLVVGL